MEAVEETGDGGERSDPGSPWSPSGGAFRPCAVAVAGAATGLVRRPAATGSCQRSSISLRMVARLTKDIVETYQICNPNFKYFEALNPKRYLTSPHVGVLNDGHDNANSDLILSVNLVLVGLCQRYIVKDILGHGTFGQVAKCWSPESNNYVAVKIIKNQPAYFRQALVEISILGTLNQKYDPDDRHHIVRILDYFKYQRHLCISFEMLGSNLYELLKINNYKGLTLNVIRDFSQQILHALVIMKNAGIIHCDLKPENILLCGSKEKPTAIKVIDFGSACTEGHTIYSYIQSRYYRSPEVLLGYPYNTAIDMWSVGCIVAELFLGLPLFPGASEFDLLKRMIEILGGQPPDDVLREAKNTSKYFKHVGSIHSLEVNELHKGCYSAYRVLTEDEFEAREMKKPVIGKKYFGNLVTLEEIIRGYPYRKNINEKELAEEKVRRLALVDFLKGLVEFDPVKRWSPLQASRHPFVTGEPFTCPYKPLLETPNIPVIHTVTVDHNPGGGHWLGAGLSPQVSSFNQSIRHSGPHFQMAASSRGGSYCSFGSHGSYTDNAFPGNSYGSYGDANNMYTYFSQVGPSAPYIQAQIGGSILGASPDIRHRPHITHGSGFGASPTSNFCHMSLGVSPSQFTPPNSQIQVPTISPGKYGPTSPARGSVHGSPLGKAAALGHYNRRRSGWGYHGNLGLQSQESTSQQWQGHHSDGFNSSHPDGNFQAYVGSTPRHSNQSNWRQQRCGIGFSSGSSSTIHSDFPAMHPFNSNVVPLHPTEISFDKHEVSSSSPDPGDWDPNYSDELLLQEDGSDVTNLASEIANGMHLGHAADVTVLPNDGGIYNWGQSQHRPNLNFFSSNERRDEMAQTYSNADGSPSLLHEMYAGHNRLSRFGQQPLQRFQHMQSNSLHGNRNDQILIRPNFNTADSRSSANSAFGSGTSWGRRVGHTFGAFLPSTHVREDFGSIA
uniref:Putative serine/threonine-protein kinase yakA n=1 Tax=Anthurium amnicola TaxID=1678845 RepID=A0A1D1Z8E6_9ARAE